MLRYTAAVVVVEEEEEEEEEGCSCSCDSELPLLRLAEEDDQDAGSTRIRMAHPARRCLLQPCLCASASAWKREEWRTDRDRV